MHFIFRIMEVGPAFRVAVPKCPVNDPNYPIIANRRSRFTHCYCYIRDEVLGPIVTCVGSFFPFKATYYLNGHSFVEHQLNCATVSFPRTTPRFLQLAAWLRCRPPPIG
jgi:hypothetical protein